MKMVVEWRIDFIAALFLKLVETVVLKKKGNKAIHNALLFIFFITCGTITLWES